MPTRRWRHQRLYRVLDELRLAAIAKASRESIEQRDALVRDTQEQRAGMAVSHCRRRLLA
jgi:hypothetical protein